MLARMLADSTDKKIKKGTIIDRPDAYWLCGIQQTVLLPLGGDMTDVRHLDAMQAEPADEECLAICIARKWVKSDFKLTPVVPVPVVETPAVSDEPVAEQLT